MFKLGLEKAEEPQIKLPTSTESQKKQENTRKKKKKNRTTSASLTMLKSLTLWITTNWKILKEMGILDSLACLLRNKQAGQEATVRTGHGKTDWFQIGKGIYQSCILSPCLFNFMQSTPCESPGWRKHKLESRLLGEISMISDTEKTSALWQKVKRN